MTNKYLQQYDHPHPARRVCLLTRAGCCSAPLWQIVYVENTPMFVQIVEGLGIRSILHTDYRSISAKLAAFALQNDEGIIYEIK